MRPIDDTFDSSIGQWLDYWTPDGVSDSAWIDAVSHLDLRSFINLDIERPRTQDELDRYSQTVLQIDPPLGTQTNLESMRIVAGENWEFSGTGINLVGANAPTVGLISSPANIRAITMVTDGNAVDATLVSSIVDDGDSVTTPINCSSTYFESPHLILTIDPNADVIIGDLSMTNSYVQLSSNTDGSFTSAAGTNTGDEETGESLKVPFAGSTYISLPISSFVNTSTGFDQAAVTGIRIHIETTGTPANLDVIQLLHGVRVVSHPLTYPANDHAIDYDTRHKTLMRSIGLDGVDDGTTLPPVIRGTFNDTDDDPRFIDGTVGLFFSTGGGLVQSGDNSIDLILREGTFDGVANRTVASLTWDNAGAASYRVRRLDDGVAFAPSDTADTSWGVTLDRAQDEDLITGRGINDDIGRYYFSATAIGASVELRLYEADATNATGSLIAQKTISNVAYKAKNGRCGFCASFSDFDAYIDEFAQGEVGYAMLRTRVFASPTPVDGIQLIANCTPDMALARDFFWVNPSETYTDTAKSPSGKGSYRTKSGLVTSNFLIQDWRHSYVSFNVWVGPNATFANQPYLLFQSTSDDENGDPIKFRANLERLQPNQWNEIYVDLLQFRNDYANLFYRMSILVPQDGGLGLFWIDDPKVNQRTIEWEGRAQADQVWRSFRGLVNNPLGGIHLPVDERGRELQVQATALTPDARIVNYKIIPHYAELGVPLFDRSYRKR